MAGETVTLALIFGKHRAAYTLPAEVAVPILTEFVAITGGPAGAGAIDQMDWVLARLADYIGEITDGPAAEAAAQAEMERVRAERQFKRFQKVEEPEEQP